MFDRSKPHLFQNNTSVVLDGSWVSDSYIISVYTFI